MAIVAVICLGSRGVAVALPCVLPVGARLGLEWLIHRSHLQVHSAQQIGQHVIGLDLEVIGLQFDGHMAVAQVVGRAHQVESRIVVVLVMTTDRDAQHGLRGRDHPHQRAVLQHQHVAAAHHAAAWQEHADVLSAGVGGVEAAFLAHIPVQLDLRRAPEQGRGQATALRNELGGLQHGGCVEQDQNRK